MENITMHLAGLWLTSHAVNLTHGQLVTVNSSYGSCFAKSQLFM